MDLRDLMMILGADPSAGRSPANSILSQLHIAALGCSESMARIAVGASQHLSIQIGTAMSCCIVILTSLMDIKGSKGYSGYSKRYGTFFWHV